MLAQSPSQEKDISMSSGSNFDQFIKDRIEGKIFSGSYTERKYVEEDSQYKDVIVVDNQETEICKMLRSLERKLKKNLKEKSIINRQIIERKHFDDAKENFSYNLLIDKNLSPLPIGHYWWFIESLEIGNCMQWKIKMIRSFCNDDKQSDRCKHCGKSQTDPTTKEQDDPLSLSEVMEKLQTIVRPVSWAREFSTSFTSDNVVHAFKFAFILLLALFSGLGKLLPQMFACFNKFIHEMAFFLKAATPFLLGCLNIVSNALGGFYLLITMIWKDLRKTTQSGKNQSWHGKPAEAIEYNSGDAKLALQSERQNMLNAGFAYRRNVQRPYFQQK